MISKLLKCGYISFKMSDSDLENKIGMPQGSILSPICCNILLNKLDLFVEKRMLEIFCDKKPISAEYTASRSYLSENWKPI